MLAVATAAILAMSAPVRSEPTCILANGDSNAWGWRVTEAGLPTVQPSRSARWTCLLDDRLSPDHTGVEDGLNLRAIDLDDMTTGSSMAGAGAKHKSLPGEPSTLGWRATETKRSSSRAHSDASALPRR